MSARWSTASGAAILLGRHVVRRAHHLAGARERQVRRACAATSFARPKSAIFTRPVAVEQDVLGLDVAVDDALVVRVLQRVADLRDDRERLRAASRRAVADHLRAGSAPSTNSMTR